MQPIRSIMLALVAGVVIPAPHMGAQQTYPDFALQPPPINTNPGPEYAAWTRVQQGVSGIERTGYGRLWATWSVGAHGHPAGYVVLLTSRDNGRTWSEPTLVIDPPGNVSAGDSALWRDPLGRLWLFWTQMYGGDGRFGVWALVSENPDAESSAWFPPRRIADGKALNKPTVLSTGEWLLTVAVPVGACSVPEMNTTYRLGLTPSVIKSLCHDLGDRKGTSVYRSVDQGKTWAWLGQARIPDVCCEHMIVERRDRSLWMLARTFYGIGQSVSTDGGKTWGQSEPSGIRHPVTRFFLRRLQSGRVLLVRHNPPEQLLRSHLTAYLSDDDGRSWTGGLLLDERNGVSYPDGVEAANGTIYIVYDRGRNTDREILMATFTEADVMQTTCVTAVCRLRTIVNRAGEQ